MSRRPPQTPSHGFTILEVLVATAVLAMLLVIILQVVSQTSTTLRQVTGKVDSFQSARAAFDIVNQKLSQATLNTYWDYDSPTSPTKYGRKSDLHFLIVKSGETNSGIYFQAPLERANSTDNEVTGVLNACGYFVSFGTDNAFKPAHVSTPMDRFRLMQAVQPTEKFSVFTSANSTWVTPLHEVPTVPSEVQDKIARPIADNIIALVAWPKLSKGEDSAGTTISSAFSYDSRTTGTIQSAQLPPVVGLTMIAIDEASAARLGGDLQPTIAGILAGKFADANNFLGDTGDLATVGKALAAAHINYQVFSSAIPLRESKWSK